MNRTNYLELSHATMITVSVLFTSSLFLPSCQKKTVAPATQPQVHVLDTIIDRTKAGICNITAFQKVYDYEKHCAFTDLTYWLDKWYLVFRVSDGHAYSKNGSIKVLKSEDGETWEDGTTYSMPDMDLRDPKFVRTQTSHLMVYTQAVAFNPNRTARYQKGVVFEADTTAPIRHQPYYIEYGKRYWPWRFSEEANTLYAIAYSQDPPLFELVKTTDFKTIETVCSFDGITNIPTEATLRFMNNKCYALIRRAGPALLGISDVSNICKFQWIELPLIGLGGPNFIFYDNNTLLISGRDYADTTYAYESNRTSLFIYKIKQRRTYRVLTLPSKGDTAYPGLYFKNGILWISYYSTHEGSTKVYLAKVELSLNKLL